MGRGGLTGRLTRGGGCCSFPLGERYADPGAPQPAPGKELSSELALSSGFVFYEAEIQLRVTGS